ncbi:TPA: hypothetical protein N0F65_003763 [Lagenidium giganteum]|uniref:Helicase-associated domain-containing protein n=1 Tax=Lagenidium giganteum TaxID=4803 RepID=A0AAV2YK04_9STRA|nr:TPA: hypothetical protein N0F65_003763 [Lagenidium giganteum]
MRALRVRVPALAAARLGGAALSTVAKTSSKTPEFGWIVPAVQAFHANEGHFAVPYHFRVPRASSSWPASVAGMPLGRTLRSFLSQLPFQRRQFAHIERELRAMGFPLDQDWKLFMWNEVTMAALTTYLETHGDLLVPMTFAVPQSQEWPRATWGVRLGVLVTNLRQKHDDLSTWQLADLRSIGFVWDVLEYRWRHELLPALRCYRHIHGHLNIPVSFVIPADDERWPEKLWGIRLGKFASKIRVGTFSEQVEESAEELKLLGFSFDVSETSWQLKIMPALHTYKELFGHCIVESRFVVPSCPPWPKEAYGLPLGNVVTNMRSHGSYAVQAERDRAELDELGFAWDFMDAKWKEIVRPALETFVQIHGHTRIPTSFVVPSRPPWPSIASGLRLGVLASNIRVRGYYRKFVERDRSDLEALGYEF